MGILSSLVGVFTKDLTGRTWERETSHPYFAKLVYFGSKERDRSYWEAELPLTGARGAGVSATMRGTADGPSEYEVAFCRSIAGDLDAVFERCRPAFETEFLKWAKRPIAENWRKDFILDGLDVPVEGNAEAQWHVCYFVEPAGHYFTAEFVDGRVAQVTVDG